MKHFIAYFLVASVAAHVVLMLLFPGTQRLVAFAYGWTVFAANLAILGLLGYKLLANSNAHPKGSRGGLGFALLSLLKLPLLGAAIYFGLAVLELSPWFLVAGAGTGLVLTTVLFYWQYQGGARSVA